MKGHFISHCQNFLNGLDEYLPQLIDETAKVLLAKPDIISDISAIMIYGNDMLYLETYVHLLIKKCFGKNTLRFETNDEEDYMFTDVHFEMDYNPKHNNRIKALVTNRSISGKQVVFVLKSPQNLASLRHVMDSNPQAKFIVLTKSIKSMDTSRFMMVRLSFVYERCYEFVKGFCGYSKTFAEFRDGFKDKSLIMFITKLQGNGEKLALYKAIDKALDDVKKTRKPLEKMHIVRDLCYKLYHMNVPLDMLCKYIITSYQESPNIVDIVQISAACQLESVQSNKSMLCYEDYFLKVIQKTT